MMIRNFRKSQSLLRSVVKNRFLSDLREQHMLNEDDYNIKEVTLQFAKDNLQPFAQEWDEHKHFPIEQIKRIS